MAAPWLPACDGCAVDPRRSYTLEWRREYRRGRRLPRARFAVCPGCLEERGTRRVDLLDAVALGRLQ